MEGKFPTVRSFTLKISLVCMQALNKVNFLCTVLGKVNVPTAKVLGTA